MQPPTGINDQKVSISWWLGHSLTSFSMWAGGRVGVLFSSSSGLYLLTSSILKVWRVVGKWDVYLEERMRAKGSHAFWWLCFFSSNSI